MDCVITVVSNAIVKGEVAYTRGQVHAHTVYYIFYFCQIQLLCPDSLFCSLNLVPPGFIQERYMFSVDLVIGVCNTTFLRINPTQASDCSQNPKGNCDFSTGLAKCKLC